jgi:uncharacterized protein YndB with AHSA1/START domain
MERKTKIHAEEGKQDLTITREFDLPVELLYRAYTEAEIVEQWMRTKVIKLENKKHGSYEFETSDANGNVLFKAHGTVHDVVPNQKIVRTFEMVNVGFDVQLEFLDFSFLTPDTSQLSMHIVYRSPEHREKQLKMPFAYGINMAHNKLQDILSKIK